MHKLFTTLTILLQIGLFQFSYSQTSSDAEEILKLVNAARTERGLSPVVLNENLNISATKHSQDMQRSGGLDHTGSDGSSFGQRARRDGYKGSPRGENIAWGYRSPQSVHNGWMTSPGHRGNILNPNVNEMGIGRAENYWTQVFGRGNVSVLSTNDFALNENKVIAYPNPTKGNISLTSKEKININSADLYDLSGRLVKHFDINKSNANNTINIEDVTSGAYILQVEGSNKAYKIIKE